MGRSRVAVQQILVVGSLVSSWLNAADSSNIELERKFTQTVRPFLASYCVGCHGGASPAAQFDLRHYSTVAGAVPF